MNQDQPYPAPDGNGDPTIQYIPMMMENAQVTGLFFAILMREGGQIKLSHKDMERIEALAAGNHIGAELWNPIVKTPSGDLHYDGPNRPKKSEKHSIIIRLKAEPIPQPEGPSNIVVPPGVTQ
jgi:hypothetical protein